MKPATLVVSIWMTAAAVAQTQPAPITPQETLKTLRVPPGFTVELVAAQPLVRRPIMASFDERGRLYVADSAGVNVRGPELVKDPPHRILLLEDTDGDGVFDKSSVFADKLVFPQGLLWHDGAVYCASPPSLWKLQDTDGDGVADTRTQLITGFALTGVSDDVHGACLGPDGRIYTCAGRFPHKLTDIHGRVFDVGPAPLLVRCRPDGEDAEVVGGIQGNGVEVAWTPSGDAIVSGTFYGGTGMRDALIHAVEGGDYPVLGFTPEKHEMPRTGDMLPPLVHMTATAPSGITRFRGRAFGPGYADNIFCCYFNLHSVQRHVLTPDGATYRATAEDFLTSTSPDFHPTDVLQDADGSLLVVDTGGWFRIGCPTSKIAKPDVTGAIYRIRRIGSPKIDDPRGLNIGWRSPDAAALIRLLDDPRPQVQDRAVEWLATPSGVGPLSGALARGHSSATRLNAVWALTRIDSHDARAAVRAALADDDPAVRKAAAYSAGLHRDAAARAELVRLVESDASPAVRREAANSLGRLGSGTSVPALLAALKPLSGAAADRFLEHALVLALIRANDTAPLAEALGGKDPGLRRAALVALDQMPAGRLTPEVVMPLLDPADPLLQREAFRTIARHGDWGPKIRPFFERALAQPPPADDARREELKQQLVAFTAVPAVQSLISEVLGKEDIPVSTRLLLLEAMQEAPVDHPPAGWAERIAAALGDKDERVVRQAVYAARALPRSKDVNLDRPLLAVARGGAPDETRVDAMLALEDRLDLAAAGNGPLFMLLQACLAKAKPAALRGSAADVLAGAKMSDHQRRELLPSIKAAGPLELPRLLAAYRPCADAGIGNELIATLNKTPAAASLRAALLADALTSFPPEVHASAAPLLKKLSADLEEQKAHLAELAPVLAGGDPGRGRALFFGPKAACSTCHTVGGQGGNVGPDLSKIGSIRAPRDLLEAIAYPSATFARGFEPYTVKLKDGTVEAGILSREAATAISLTTGPRSVKRIPRSAIVDIRQSQVSVMPQGFDAQLTRAELADLIAFLSGLK